MSENLSALPPLEEVMKSLKGESHRVREVSPPHLIVEHCPIMRRKTGGDDEIHILQDRVVCEHIMEGIDYSNHRWSDPLEKARTGTVDVCGLLADSRIEEKKNSTRYNNNLPEVKCPYYESYVKGRG